MIPAIPGTPGTGTTTPPPWAGPTGPTGPGPSGPASLLSIGEFSRLTHASVKALRHYHDLGLLHPARIDPDSGYRYYATAQAPAAQLIRRFRDLGMPLEQVKAVLTATDPAAREDVIAGHLRTMERQLEDTQAAVASLRGLLEGGGPPSPDIAFRTLDGEAALRVSARVAWDDLFGWLRDTLADLRREIGSEPGLRGGPDGALYSAEFFASHVGEVTAFIPLGPNAGAGNPAVAGTAGPTGTAGGAGPLGGVLPAGPVAVATHRGSFRELDRTYAALGTFVAEQGVASRARTAIRENYLASLFTTDDEQGLATEVCWPVLTTEGDEEA